MIVQCQYLYVTYDKYFSTTGTNLTTVGRADGITATNSICLLAS